MNPRLTLAALRSEARTFAEVESAHCDKSLFGVTDGKTVGTYFEHKFQSYLHERYQYNEGSSAKGIDFPDLDVDMKVTSIKKPQSSCPYKSARQKIFGLGYHVLVFVYEKIDDMAASTGRLDVRHVIFLKKQCTADYQTTRGITEILDNDGNEDDLVAFMQDRNLPVDDIQASSIAREVLKKRPEIGYLTISNALQWRLHYQRIIEEAGSVNGIIRVR